MMMGTKPIRVACIGGGQLGRMMQLEAPRLNIEMSFLDPLGADCPANIGGPTTSQENEGRIIKGSLQDAAAVEQIATAADVITVEIEHVNVEALEALEAAGKNVQPSARVLKIIRDKYLQKQHFAEHEIATPPFCVCPTIRSIEEACQTLGVPLMLKTRRGGYDGRGNAVLKSADPTDIQEALVRLGVAAADDSADLGLYAEGWIEFTMEIAVMVVRSSLAATTTASDDSTGTTTRCYPAVNAIQQDSICRIVLVPARNLSTKLRHQAEQLAIRAIDSLGAGASGMFGVEMFVTATNDILLNEVAPRPHNTGHYTQNACICNQFENHLRAVCGLPLGSTDLLVPAAAMVNVLGATTMEETCASSNAALRTMPRAVVHWYGKKECRAGRKMGHINITGDSVAAVDRDLLQLMELEKIPLSVLPQGTFSLSSSSISKEIKSPPLVGVIMGSHSDLPTMQAAVDVLKQFQIPYEVDVVSAHRTPDKLMAYSRSAADRGLLVIIAGAGGAAHLPGMVAAMTPLPVVGVPVKTSTLSGVDSLYSIVQMPRGVPVATVAIGNAMNAGLLAVRIVSTKYPALLEQMKDYQTKMKDDVDAVSTKLIEMGSDAFLAQMDSKNQAVNV